MLAAEEQSAQNTPQESRSENHENADLIKEIAEQRDDIIKRAWRVLAQRDLHEAERLVLSIIPPPTGFATFLIEPSETVQYYDFENDLEEQFFRSWKNEEGKSDKMETKYKEIQRNPLPCLGAYSILAFILVEKREYEKALQVLAEAIRRNPVRAGFREECVEIFKFRKELDKVWAETKECWKYTYRVEGIAKCYRVWGFCLVEWKRWNDAISLFVHSLSFEPNNQTALTELNYIAAHRPGEMPDIKAVVREIPDVLQRLDLPLRPNQKWIDLAKRLANTAYMEARWEQATFYFNVVFLLTKDPVIAELRQECYLNASQRGVALPFPKLSKIVTYRKNEDGSIPLDDLTSTLGAEDMGEENSSTGAGK